MMSKKIFFIMSFGVIQLYGAQKKNIRELTIVELRENIAGIPKDILVTEQNRLVRILDNLLKDVSAKVSEKVIAKLQEFKEKYGHCPTQRIINSWASEISSGDIEILDMRIKLIPETDPIVHRLNIIEAERRRREEVKAQSEMKEERKGP